MEMLLDYKKLYLEMLQMRWEKFVLKVFYSRCCFLKNEIFEENNKSLKKYDFFELMGFLL